MDSKQIRTKIRRLYVPNAVYFVTCVTRDRKPIFAERSNISCCALQCAGSSRSIHSKCVRNHIHLQLFVPETTTISKIMHSIQRNFTVNYKKARKSSKKIRMWQRGFWDHVIGDERDWVHHLDYIHYNPVKHGYVSKPEDYPHTSFRDYVRRGWYEIGWGHASPETMEYLDYE